MLVVCDQCQARYKITIAKTPGKAVTFKCGKCQHLIRLSPEQIEVGAAPATGVRPAAVKPRPEKPAAPPSADAPPGAEPETVRGNCLKCGAPYVKPVSDKSTVCYQCRIDSLVHKVREKYGVAEAPAAPAPEAPAAPEPAPEASRYTIRSADGLVLGPIKLRTVAVLAREKRISGREEVAKEEGEFAPLMSYPELAELFPNLKEILDTDGLEDKVDEAFMAAFGADEGEGKAERDSAETNEDVAGLGSWEASAPPAAEPAAPAATEPEAPAEEPSAPSAAEESALGLDDLGADEPAVEPPAPAAPLPAVEDSSVEIEHSFKLTDPTGPRRAIKPDAAPAEPAASPAAPAKLEPPVKIVEKASALAEVSSAPRHEEAPGEGTEFDVGQEWDDSGGEGGREEVIEDLEAIEPPPDARYRIRYPDGLMLGPVKYGTIKELFKAGNLTGQEEVQRDDADWSPFADLPELAVLMAEADEAMDDVMELTDLLEEK